MLIPAEVVFLFDVDNTLLDNDRFAADLSAHLTREFGAAERDRYWALYAKLRDELGYSDYLATLQAFGAGLDDEPALLQMSTFLLEYPFARRIYPGALEALAHLAALGTAVVLTDGEWVFQPRKVQRSGIWDAVAGRVLVTRHKECSLDLVRRRYPASHYVAIDDKLQLLAAMKQALNASLTTVFVRQGHYATESESLAFDPPPDLTIGHIGDLCAFAWPDLLAAVATS